jgi:diaminobutyrate-2-oxoglutarate transaminase
MKIFDRLESEVRAYCRSFPTVFERAVGSRLFDEHGRAYVDFLSGCGTLNYGHNPPHLKRALIDYIERDGITHGLDLATTAKRTFLERFEEVVLLPRGMQYKLQFPGPTGTNAIESALKLARKVTGREGLVGFTNAFHGMTLGALSLTGSRFKRRSAGVPLQHVTSLPFDGFLGESVDTLDYFEAMISRHGSGLDRPAAVVVETIQAEGGINVASRRWLERLQRLCREFEILLIVDDIQVGCGRTGPFFSFEEMDLQPDIICLAKSLSGYGLPLALTLIRPDLDIWEPGEHNGTFRGNNHAFLTAAAALDFWVDDTLQREVARKEQIVRARLEDIKCKNEALDATVRGRGLIQGMECPPPGLASAISRRAFECGLLLEISGPDSNVVKLMPPLVIEDALLEEGLEILADSVGAAFDEHTRGGA